MVKTLHHVNITDKTLPSNEFNCHGLHLNTLGKERINQLRGHSTTHSLTRQNNLPISLTQKEDLFDPAPSENAVSSTNECT